MERSKYITLSFFLLFSTQSSAINLAEINQPLEQGLYDSRSCNDLYMQATFLEKDMFAHKTNNSDKTQVASLVSTVFAPAIDYLGYSAYQDYKNETHSKLAFAEIEEIRFRMAEKRCFIK